MAYLLRQALSFRGVFGLELTNEILLVLGEAGEVFEPGGYDDAVSRRGRKEPS
jgi:hypothetical protein